MHLTYKKDLGQTLERLRSLYDRRSEDRIFAAFEVPSKALEKYLEQHPIGFSPYPDPQERVQFWDDYLRERLEIQDDSVPSAYLSELDQGLYGGLLNGQVEFMLHDNGWISSMTTPILADWDDLETIRFDPGHFWFQRYLHQLEVFRSAAEGKFGISHFILIDGLNLVFELVGATQTYLSLFEHPDKVKEAIELGFHVNLAVQQTFFEHIPLLEGGTYSNMAQWVPGRILSESVDPFHMTGLQCYEEWGRENVERIFSRFDGGVLHLHGNGRHLLEAVCRLKGLKALYLGDDVGFPPAFDVISELRRRSGNLPLIINADFDKFRAALTGRQLPGGVFYRIQGAPDVDSANHCMEAVRAYR